MQTIRSGVFDFPNGKSVNNLCLELRLLPAKLQGAIPNPCDNIGGVAGVSPAEGGSDQRSGRAGGDFPLLKKEDENGRK